MSIHDRFVMGSEPLPDLSADDIRQWLTEHTDKQSIIDAYAAVHNKAWWIEDNVYDCEEGTKAYIYACEQTDAWFTLMNELLEIIFGYIRDEGVTIPEKGYNKILVPFMEDHGYNDGNGWWIKKK